MLVVGVAQHGFRESTQVAHTANLRPQDVKEIMRAVSRGRWVLLHEALRKGNFRTSGQLLRDIALGRACNIGMNSQFEFEYTDLRAIAWVDTVSLNRGGFSYSLVLDTKRWRLIGSSSSSAW